MKRKILIISGTIVSLVAVFIFQYYYDQEARSFAAKKDQQPLVVNESTLKDFNFGLQAFLADCFWLQAIQYYGGWRNDQNFEKLTDYLNLTTELDPHFSYPYAFAALILPTEGQEAGYTIAEKGVERKLKDWHIPYYLAMAEFLYRKDKTAAARYFDLAATTEGAPASTQYVSAAFGSRPDNRQTVIAIWQTIYETSTDEIAKGRAEKYLIHFEIMNLLDQTSIEYKKRFGAFPKAPEDLVKVNILKALPTDPFGFEFKFGEDGVVVIKNSK
jgi:hypothetical protein